VGWRCDPKKSGGGPLMDIAPHLFDLAGFFLDDRAVSVAAYTTPVKNDKEIEMDAHVLLEFSKGAHACIDTSFLRGNMHNYTVIGEKGQLRASGTMCWNNKTDGIGKGRLILEKGNKESIVDFDAHEHIAKETAMFCDAVENGWEVPVPGEAGLHVQEMIDASYRSGSTGSMIKIGIED
jgi:predicted dehydrogenase